MEITFDAKGLDEAIRALAKVQGGLGKALERTLNRTGPGMRTDAVREITTIYRAMAKRVRKDLHVTKASARYESFEVRLMVKKGARKLGLPAFKTRPAKPTTRPPKAGVLVSVRKDKGGGKRIKHGFVARTESGHVGVFVRKKQGGKRVGRSPIAELKGPSVRGMLKNETVQKNAHTKAQERADKRLPQEVKHVLRQAGFID